MVPQIEIDRFGYFRLPEDARTMKNNGGVHKVLG